MKKVTIGNLPGISIKTFGSMYLSSFSAMWLVLEPLGAFGIFPNAVSNLGWVGYVSLFVLSLLVAIPISPIWRKLIFNNQEFIRVRVESSLEGINYQVKAPANLQVWDFSHLFIEHLEKGEASEKVKALRRGYSPVLNVKRNGEKTELDNNITLKEAGLLDTDVLFVLGKPIEVDLSPRFSTKTAG